MLNWKIWEGTGKEWDDCLLQFPDFTVYQSFSWGEHRGAFGWHPLRIVGECDGRVVSAAQVLVRRLPLGIGFVWIPGGPAGDPEIWTSSFPTGLKKALGSRFVYCRMSNMRPHDAAESGQLSRHGWHKPGFRLQSGQSMSYLLGGQQSARQDRMSKNWSRNFRRSQKSGNVVRVWDSPDPGEMHAVYREMQDFKSLDEQFTQAALASILSRFEGRCVVVRCDDSEGRLLSFRGALLFGKRGWDIFAATTIAGRKVYASHATFWELMKQCEERGVTWYDMSGVDPDKNKGGYDFKKGTGAEDLKYLGEWDRASFPLLRPLANLFVKWRMRSA